MKDIYEHPDGPAIHYSTEARMLVVISAEGAVALIPIGPVGLREVALNLIKAAEAAK